MKMHKNDRKWFKPVFDFEDGNSPKKICLESNNTATAAPNFAFEPKSINKNVSPKTALSGNWTDNFSPLNIQELAVNSKKVQEVKDWILNSINKNRMLLLTGPPGCGKTTTVNVLAKDLNIDISEWVTPVDIEYVREFDSDVHTYVEKQSEKFKDFLLKASRYPSLLTSSDSKKIILVEDYPNTFFKNPSEFFDILKKYQARGKAPLIFICTDTSSKSLNIAWNLFPPNVQETFKFHHISFNPVTTTNMKNALKRITTLMSKTSPNMYESPNQECVDSIINSSMGDIRSAVNSLHFVSLKTLAGSIHDISLRKSTKTKTKRKKDSGMKLNLMGKDEIITIMHGVGRVLNPKFEKNDQSEYAKLTHSPKEIAEQFETQPQSFIGYIQENYLPHFSDINFVEKAATHLSDADYLAREWRDNTKFYGLIVAIGGVMIANKNPVTSWHPIKAPKNIKTEKLESEFASLIDTQHNFQPKILKTDFKTYCEIIKKSNVNYTDDMEVDDIFSD